MLSPRALRCLALACGAVALPAQQLARDINPGPAVGQWAMPSLQFASSDGQRAFFDGWTQDGGIELWVSDGTAAGTQLVRDLFPGAASSGPEPIQWVGNRLLLSTRNGTQRGRLWATDGTPAGTVPVSNLPTFGGGFRGLGVLQGRAIFGGDRVWASDLSSAGTVQVATCQVQGTYVQSGALGNRLLFSGNGDAAGNEPWVTDGTPAGTLRLADVHPVYGSQPDWWTPLGGQVYFFATGPAGTAELWRSDGTPAGTQRVLATTFVRNSLQPERLVRAGGALLAMLGGGLWRSDGTAAGTSLLLPAGSSSASSARELLSDGTTAFCIHGTQLWRSDGSVAGTQFVVDLGAVVAPPRVLLYRSFVHQGQLRLASASYALGATTIIASDGTAAGTTMADVVGTNAPGIVRIGSQALVLGRNLGVGSLPFLTISDGTVVGTQELWRPASFAGNTPQKCATNNGVLYTFADDGVHGLELWRSDGTAAGTRLVADLHPGPESSISSANVEIVALDGFVYFTAFTPATGVAVWRTDGTTAGTTLVYDTHGALAGAPGQLTVDGHDLYFTDLEPVGGRITVLRTDGTSQGTTVVPGIPNTYYYRFGVVGGGVVLSGPNFTLWRTDGTPAGSFPLPGPWPHVCTRLGDRIVFFGYETGNPLWVTDGTVAGTHQLLTSVAGAPTTGSLRPWKNGLARLSGTELVFTDGTVAGTSRTILPLPGDPLSFAFAGDWLYVVAEDPQYGRELWRSDGTVAGTQRATDLAPGFQHGVASVFSTPLGERVLLAASQGLDGLEPYASDGTAAGTVRIADLAPNGSSNPQFLAVAGDRLYYLADDGTTGQELGSMPLAAIGSPALESYGVGCPGAAGLPELAAGTPRTGGPIDYRLRRARAFAPCLFTFAAGHAPTVLPGGCVLHAGSGVVMFGATDGLGEAARSIVVPADPAFLGLLVAAQALVLDAAGTALPGLAASQGLVAVVGL